jgi:hypothetical protein
MNHSTPLLGLFLIAHSLSIGCGGLYTTPYTDTGVASDVADRDDEEDVSELDEEDPGSSEDDFSDEDSSGSDDSSGGGGGSWGGDGSSPGSSGGSTGSSCTYNDFPVAIHQATQNNEDPARPMFLYQARSTDGSPFTELQMMSFQAEPYFGPSAPGDYDLSGLNYADCALCMMVLQECTDEYYCEKGFFIQSGTLEVNQLSMYGGNFKASLVNARFVEVTIDPETYQSTPVDGGESWCVDRIDIDVSTYLTE